MDSKIDENVSEPLIGAPSNTSFLEKKNILAGILFIVLGLFFLVNSIIIKNPHKTSFDRKEVHTEEELKTKDTYTYEHEKGGDRRLRLTTSYILMSLFTNCLTLAIIFFIGTNNDLDFKNKGFMIAAGIFGATFVGCLIYYLVWRSGALNKGANKKYSKIEEEKTCRAEGEGIIYDHCAINDILDIYNTCVEPVKGRHRAKCSVELPKYLRLKQDLKVANDERTARDETPEINPSEDMLKNKSLSLATYNKYKNLDNPQGEPLTCERYVNIQVENNPISIKCKKSSIKDYQKTDKHKDCIKKSKKQSKLDINDLYNMDTQDGTTFSNCTEKKKYNEIKFSAVEEKIKAEVDKLELSDRGDDGQSLTTFTESEAGGTVTDSSVDTSGSGADVGGSIDGINFPQ